MHAIQATYGNKAHHILQRGTIPCWRFLFEIWNSYQALQNHAVSHARLMHSGQEVLWPVSMQAVLQMPKDGPVEFHAVSMEADGGGAVDHHMSLSRANLTLILDVLAENVCYAGRSGHVGTSLLPQPTTQNQKRRSGFCFSWRWPGHSKLNILPKSSCRRTFPYL